MKIQWWVLNEIRLTFVLRYDWKTKEIKHKDSSNLTGNFYRKWWKAGGWRVRSWDESSRRRKMVHRCVSSFCSVHDCWIWNGRCWSRSRTCQSKEFYRLLIKKKNLHSVSFLGITIIQNSDRDLYSGANAVRFERQSWNDIGFTFVNTSRLSWKKNKSVNDWSSSSSWVGKYRHDGKAWSIEKSCAGKSRSSSVTSHCCRFSCGDRFNFCRLGTWRFDQSSTCTCSMQQ